MEGYIVDGLASFADVSRICLLEAAVVVHGDGIIIRSSGRSKETRERAEEFYG
jgi:hypothetical protein